MALRDLAGGAARLNASFWREVAQSVDPKPRGSKELSTPTTPVPELPSEPEHQPGEPGLVEGGMLVPIDTWTRVLEQLGNLHQAGQDLAVARERAARAETEAQFLREQLTQAKAQRSARPRRRSPAPQTPAPAATTREPETSDSAPRAPRVTLVRGSVTRARVQVSEWLRPTSG